jgi:hypothetical protein
MKTKVYECPVKLKGPTTPAGVVGLFAVVVLYERRN